MLLTLPFRIHHDAVRNSPQVVGAAGRKEEMEHMLPLNLGPHL